MPKSKSVSDNITLHVFEWHNQAYLFCGESMLIARIPKSFATAVRADIRSRRDLTASCESAGVGRGLAELEEMGFFKPQLSNDDLGGLLQQRNAFVDGRELVVLQLVISGSCNLSCRYCYANQGAFNNKDAPAFMSLRTVRQAAELFFAHSAKGTFVHLLGGEPLLHPQLLSAVDTIVHESAKASRQVALSATTNGTVLNGQIIVMLRKHSVRVSVSLDGPAEVHDVQRPTSSGRGSFAKAMEHLGQLWSELGPEFVSVRVTCTPYNLPFLRAFLHELRSAFRDIRVEFSPVVLPSGLPLSLSRSNVDEFVSLQRELFNEELTRLNDPRLRRDEALQKLEHNRIYNRQPLLAKCEIGMNLITVAPNGFIYPCVGLLQDDTYAMGTVAQGGLSCPVSVISLYRQNNVVTRTGCQQCWAKYICAGGCVAASRAVAGKELSTDATMCTLYQSAAEMALLSCVVKCERPQFNTLTGIC